MYALAVTIQMLVQIISLLILIRILHLLLDGAEQSLLYGA